MIDSKSTYKEYVRQDIAAYGLSRVSLYDYWWQDSLRFQLRLRKAEYLYNCKKNSPICSAIRFCIEVLNHRLATRLGFTIPKNVFGPGLCIAHYGTIVVSPKAKVGCNCRLHPSTSIGDYNGSPVLGNNVYVGPGARLFGPITIGDNVAIGANSVVKNDIESNVMVAGVPARVLSTKGAIEHGVFSAANMANPQFFQFGEN